MTCTKIKHSSHKHELKLINNRTPYECNGCKEPGWGDRYSCKKWIKPCEYHLHENCAMRSNSPLFHPFFEKGTASFNFIERAPGPHDKYCSACGKKVQGYVYHCHKTGDSLHPVCFKLPLVAQEDGVEAHLKKEISKNCTKCGTKIKISSHTSSKPAKCWSYKYNTNEEYHVACLIEMMANNLEKGCNPELQRNSASTGLTNVPNYYQPERAGTSTQSSNLENTKTFANLLLTVIFGGVQLGLLL